MKTLPFQQMIMKLTEFWANHGCTILHPYDLEVGAGTFHSATVLKSLTENPWNVAYLQPSRRPVDSRFGIHPNRLQDYYQFQVILKPSPNNIQQLYLDSIAELGVDSSEFDIRFVEDDWESPTLGASGLGWEVWCDGMEVSQFTYMQQVGGLECRPVPGELTYGLERIALYTQKKDHVMDLDWNGMAGDANLTYGDLEQEAERQFSHFNLEFADVEILLRHFEDAEKQCEALIKEQLPLPAYDYCCKASHLFNLLCARGVVSVTERASYISRVRHLAKICCVAWVALKSE